MFRCSFKKRTAIHVFFGIFCLITQHSFALDVTGFVKDTQNNPLVASITLQNPTNGDTMYHTTSDANGYFLFSNIIEDAYHIHISATGYPDQWYSNGYSTLYPQYVTYFDITKASNPLYLIMTSSPSSTPNNNTLHIHLTDSTGNTIVNSGRLSVALLRKQDNFMIYSYERTSETTFTFDTLPPAEYAIHISGDRVYPQFYKPDRNTTYPTEYIALSGGATISQYVPLADPPAGEAFLNGTCYSESNVPLSGITVSLIVFLDSTRTRYSQTTDASGHFSFNDILNIGYFLQLSGGNYMEQWYSPSRNATTQYTEEYLMPMYYVSNPLVIKVLEQPINNRLKKPLTIDVFDSTGIPVTIPGSITLIPTDGTSSIMLIQNSIYLHTYFWLAYEGSYYVKADFSPTFPVQYYHSFGTTSEPLSTITISADENSYFSLHLRPSPGIDTTDSNTTDSKTDYSGSIIGTILDKSTQLPVEGARIVLFKYTQLPFNTRHFYTEWTTYTDASGSYSLSNISPGLYRCFAEAESLNYAVQFFPSTDDISFATELTIDTFATTPITVDFFLSKGASLSGTIYNSDGSMIPNVFVYCENSEHTQWFETATDSNGTWSISGIPENTWNLWVNSDRYTVINDTIDRLYTVSGNDHIEVAPYIMKLGGMPTDQIQGPLSLWIKDDSLGYPLLSWYNDQMLTVDKYVLYRRSYSGEVSQIYSAAASSGERYYRDMLDGKRNREYIVTAIGPDVYIRSTIQWFNPREKEHSSGQLWIDVFGTRHGIQIEWGPSSLTDETTSDSVYLYRHINGDLEKVLFTRPAWEHYFNDYTWDHADSGKTFTYHVEWPGKNCVSPEASITLSDSFFAQLPVTHVVGINEKYQTISAAVAAAQNYDRIEIRAGTYKENISLQGKILTIEGDWDYGIPPVIDGNGATAIHIPFSKSSNQYNRPRISGLAFKNCDTAIAAFISCEIEACLFSDVSLGISIKADSSATVTTMLENPFTPSQPEAWIRHCTFIAHNPGDMIVSASATGIAEQPEYNGEYSGIGQFYILPMVSLSAKISMELSSIALYTSEGLHTTFPAELQGNTTKLYCNRSNVFKTATATTTDAIFFDNDITEYDPLFIDSTWWFADETSNLIGSTYDNVIGYDVRRHDFGDYEDTNMNQPLPIKNISCKTIGFNTVLLTWDPAPAVDSITRYHIYRVPGDTSLFYINQQSQWDLKISEDSLFTVIDSFSTEKAVFLDTTITLGSPYLYVVAGVNRKGYESEIAIPAPPSISSYFVNSYTNSSTVLPANQWQMVGVVGGETVSIADTAQHALFGWDDNRTPDKLYANYFKSVHMSPAHGYWFNPVSETQFSYSATALQSLQEDASSITIDCRSNATGWNLVSSPFPFSVSPQWFDTYTAWEWNSDSIGYRQASALVPWKAYWIHTDRDTALTLWQKPTLSTILASSRAKKTVTQPLWELSLSLQSGNSYDTDNRIGAITPNLAKRTIFQKQLKPPAAFDGARLYIIDNESDQDKTTKNESGHSCLYKTVTPQLSSLEWIVGIGASEHPSTLTVHNRSSLPDGWAAYWINRTTITSFEEDSTITFAPQLSDQTGILVVTSDATILHRFTGTLLLTVPINTVRNRIVIEYSLPYNWTENMVTSGETVLPISLKLFDLSGRQISVLIKGKQRPGTYRTVWNGGSASGQPVAAGMYILKLTYAGNSKTVRFFRMK